MDTTSAAPATGLALIALFLVIFLLIVVSYLVSTFGIYLLAKKDGYSHPLLSFIPIVNGVVLHDIAFGTDEKTRWHFYIWIIAVVAAYGPSSPLSFLIFFTWLYSCFMTYNLFKAHGYSVGVSVISGIIPLVYILLLYVAALSNKYKYTGPQPNLLTRLQSVNTKK